MTTRVVRRPVAVGLGLVLMSAAVVSTTSAAAPAQPSRSITIVLRSPHPAKLSALARAHGLSHAQRVHRLRQLVPSTRAVRRIEGVLAHDGITTKRRSAWTLSAAAPTSLLDSAGLLGAVPKALSPHVTAILPVRSATPAFHNSAAVDGRGFRLAYTAPRVKPPVVSNHKPRPTVATIQLAGFKSSDLATFAKKTGLPNIVGTRRYRPIQVEGGSGSAASSGGGDVEVALDQESILSTSPNANQRPYFAPNSGGAYVDALAQVYDDVVQDRHAKRGGDRHIVALSTSWGNCEAAYGGSQIGAMQTMLKSIVAAGVTVFAASGDSGIYDCNDPTGTGLGNTQPGVDYPGSSPQVVGVGGTNLQPRGSRPRRNSGHNWRETAWSCRNPASCEGNGLLPILPNGTGGTGGGESGASGGLLSGGGFGGFKAPAYQRHNVKGALYGHQKKRMVPDIAADGDPQTGFALYSSDSDVASARDQRGFVQVGGTSLSAPLSAALFTNLLAHHGRFTGIGDIHPALYKAYAKARHRVFRDITSGINGAPANRGHNPSVMAHKGYDTLTGLGAVLWPRLAPYLHL